MAHRDAIPLHSGDSLRCPHCRRWHLTLGHRLHVEAFRQRRQREEAVARSAQRPIMVCMRFVALAALLFCAACGRDMPAMTTPTPIPSSVRFGASPPPFDATPFTGPVIPQFAGKWRASGPLPGCVARPDVASICSAYQRIWRVQPPVVEMTLTQTGNQLEGTARLYPLYDGPVAGVVTAYGGFVVNGSGTNGDGFRTFS